MNSHVDLSNLAPIRTYAERIGKKTNEGKMKYTKSGLKFIMSKIFILLTAALYFVIFRKDATAHYISTYTATSNCGTYDICNFYNAQQNWGIKCFSGSYCAGNCTSTVPSCLRCPEGGTVSSSLYAAVACSVTCCHHNGLGSTYKDPSHSYIINYCVSASFNYKSITDCYKSGGSDTSGTFIYEPYCQYSL